MRVSIADRVLPARRKSFVAAASGFSAFFLVTLTAGLVSFGPACAQPAPQGIIGIGNAVVTGFSGVLPPAAPVPPGLTPADKTYIDTSGPSARIIDLQNMGGTPAGQLVNAPKHFTATADQIGQVYAVALDNAVPPNAYVAATSAYGLPIVVPDADGDGRPDRTRLGAPNAAFMPGLWGPAAQGGGPGSIWKIDGVTGAVTLFANVSLDGVPNSGPALGGLAFDAATNQLFAADRETGMIHRFTLDGVDRGRFDHGVAGRTAAGLPPVPFDPASRLNIASPAFNSENPATWSLAPPARRVYGLGIRGARLFYAATEGLSIWSVSIQPDGSFGDDPRRELQVPPALAPTEIAKIVFDDQGRMILGERGITVGAYDFNVLAQESVSRVLRYALVVLKPGTPAVWQPEPDEYAIGLALQNRNANGGVAIGYGYNGTGQLDRLSCSGTVWSSGEALRRPADPATAAALEKSGPLDINGLQGTGIGLVRPANVPPLQSYFIDYDDRFDNAAARGHVGDLAIPRICGSGEIFGGPGWYPPGYWPPSFGSPIPPPPPPLPNTNLQLDKRALPPVCVAWGPGWLCQYRVRVTSTGPAPYAGPIVVADELPAAPAGAIMVFGPAPWVCAPSGPAAYHCLHPATVLNPGHSVDLNVAAWVPNAYPQCTLVNAAEIIWAPGGDSNPGDDFDSAAAAIPAKHCPPAGKQTNLRMEKRLLSCYAIGGPNHRCAFRVTLTNTGPGVYNDHIHFTDQIPAGTSALFFSPPATPFTCAGGPPNYNCQSNNPVTLNPGEQIPVTVFVNVPNAQAPALKCQVRNEAAITHAPGGTPQNTNAADDTADATGNLPPALCPIVLPISNLRLDKNAQDGICHGAGGGWQCDYTVRVTNTGPAAFSGQISVLDWIPPASPPGIKVSFSSPQPWNCGPVIGNVYGCTINANLAPGQFRFFFVRAFVPLQHGICSLANTARIVIPGSPTLQNLNAGDDLASANATFLPLITLPFEFYCAAPAVHEPEKCPANAILNRATGRCMPLGVKPPAPPPLPPGPPCRAGQVRNPLTGECATPPQVCKPGQLRDARTGNCVTPPCPQGQKRDLRTGLCIAPPPPRCPQGQKHNPQTSACVPVIPTCPQGRKHNPQNSACVPTIPTCPPGQSHNVKTSACAPIVPTCKQGQTHNRATSACVTPPPACPPGLTHNRQTSQCAPSTIGTPPPPPCPPGQIRNSQGQCAAPPPVFRPLQQQRPQIR